MKILIISDIHGNLEAIQSLSEDFNELWVLGDLVNYGPDPDEVVDFIRSKASVLVRGNHDHAIGFNDDPQCSKPFRDMADAMKQYTRSVLSQAQKQFLRELPLKADLDIGGLRVALCHAVPSDPMYAYCLPDSDRWQRELEEAQSDVLFVGHTHIPFIRQIGRRMIVNPGSLGQPKGGSPAARFAVWDTARGIFGIELKSLVYPLERTIEKIHALPIERQIARQLADVLRNGGIASASAEQALPSS
jgi:protein phosphatase